MTMKSDGVDGHERAILQEMPKPGFFGRQVLGIVRVGIHPDGKLLDNFQAVPLQSNHLLWVIGEQSDGLQSQVNQYLRADTIIPEVHRKTELEIGIDGIQSVFLQFIGPYLVGQTDASPFLPHIQYYPTPFVLNALHRGMQLRPAVAPAGTKNITGQALTMDPDQHVIPVLDPPFYESEMVGVVDA